MIDINTNNDLMNNKYLNDKYDKILIILKTTIICNMIIILSVYRLYIWSLILIIYTITN